jgi:Lipocalin-like domain
LYVLPVEDNLMTTLVGTWKLVSATEGTGKGEKRDLFGRNPTGFLTYTADGRMMAIIANGSRKPLSVNDFFGAPADERAEAFSTFAAYAGRYTREGDTVIHHVEIASIQNFVGTDLVRTIVALQSGRLTLRTPPTKRGGAKVTAEVVWERIGEGISDATH